MAATFQGMISALQAFWEEQGCVIVQPYHTEVGAGTSNPATLLRVLGPEPWRAAYVEPSIRPDDGRYAENPYRFQEHYQYQVILKPAPDDVQDMYLDSLRAIGIPIEQHDVRFVEDNWESPSLGAWGLGWEVWMDGMEITQFTYFQQAGGIELDPVSAEITYGLERLAMHLQNVRRAHDMAWSPGVTWADVREAGSGSSRPTTTSWPTRRCWPGTSTITRPRRAGASRRGCRWSPTTTCSSARTPSTCSTRAGRSRSPTGRRTSCGCGG